MIKHPETAYVMRSGMPASYQKVVVDPFLKRMGPPDPRKLIVDAHAGRGAVGFYIAEQGYRVALIDYNPVVFDDKTRSKADSKGVKLINENISGYARENPSSVYALQAKDPWDGDIGTDGDRIRSCITTFHNLLEPGGYLLVASVHFWGYIMTYLLIKQAGFDKIKISSWTPTESEVIHDWYQHGDAEKRYVLSCRKHA